jgi:hypothetical protein
MDFVRHALHTETPDGPRSVVKEHDMKNKEITARSALKLTPLDNFLKDQGRIEEFEAVAIKEVIACQLD